MTVNDQRPKRPSGRMPFSILSPPIQSFMIVIVAIGMSIMWWLPLRIMGESIRRQQLDSEMGALAHHCVDNPWHIQFLTIPAVLVSAMVFVIKRGRMLVVSIAWMLELIPLAALIYVFVSFLAPLYTYQDL